MKRLTAKIKGSNNYCEFELKNAKYKDLFELSSNREIENYVNADLTIAIDKLGKLEDIEKELGIDLITLFEIYKQLNVKKEVWFKYEKEMDEELKFMNSHRHKWVSYLIDFECKAFVEMEYEPVYYFYFKDYGKTWALTKGELKK